MRCSVFDELHPGQQEAVAALLDGQDILAVLPTGAGKSAIYQMAAVLLDGPAVVVSPLLALQRDQVELDAGAATAVSSRIGAREKRRRLEDFGDGELSTCSSHPSSSTTPRCWPSSGRRGRRCS